MIGEGSIINNRFRLDRLLGRGGFAQVFLATDAVLGRQVAIKILNPAQGGAEGFDFLGRFQTEARAVAALEHPNLLGIYDFGEVEGTAYLVMPYIDGGNLQDRIAGGQILPLRQVANYLGQTAAGLDYAHRRGIVHRDIKPQNLLIRAEDNRLLIADFGVAKVMQGNSASTQTAAIGTVSYMAPEQLSGRAAPSIDVYALGCVLFQLLTGRVPDAGPATQVMLAHMNSPIPSVQEHSGGRLPAAFQPLFNRALAKTPEDRFATAEELARAFEALLATISAPIPPPITSPSAPTQIGGATPGLRSNPPASLPAVPSTPPAQPTPPAVTPSASPQPAPGPVISPMLQRPATPSPVAQAPATPPDPAASRRTWLMLAGIGALVVIVIIVAALLINLIRPQSNTTPTPNARPSPAAATLTTGVTGLSQHPDRTQRDVAAQFNRPGERASSTHPLSHRRRIGRSTLGWPPSAAPSPAASPTATGSRAPSAAPSVAPAAVEPGPVLVGHSDHARAVAWLQSGDRLISGSSDGTVRIWSTAGALLNTFSGRTFAVTSVVLSPTAACSRSARTTGRSTSGKSMGPRCRSFLGTPSRCPASPGHRTARTSSPARKMAPSASGRSVSRKGGC
ncbi:MAG: serine/threonine-protein kinase [Thermomicrobiales bacterium]